jgi:hypothetical protein
MMKPSLHRNLVDEAYECKAGEQESGGTIWANGYGHGYVTFARDYFFPVNHVECAAVRTECFRCFCAPRGA